MNTTQDAIVMMIFHRNDPMETDLANYYISLIGDYWYHVRKFIDDSKLENSQFYIRGPEYTRPVWEKRIKTKLSDDDWDLVKMEPEETMAKIKENFYRIEHVYYELFVNMVTRLGKREPLRIEDVFRIFIYLGLVRSLYGIVLCEAVDFTTYDIYAVTDVRLAKAPKEARQCLYPLPSKTGKCTYKEYAYAFSNDVILVGIPYDITDHIDMLVHPMRYVRREIDNYIKIVRNRNIHGNTIRSVISKQNDVNVLYCYIGNDNKISKDDKNLLFFTLGYLIREVGGFSDDLSELLTGFLLGCNQAIEIDDMTEPDERSNLRYADSITNELIKCNSDKVHHILHELIEQRLVPSNSAERLFIEFKTVLAMILHLADYIQYISTRI